jgi:hypothetical protein
MKDDHLPDPKADLCQRVLCMVQLTTFAAQHDAGNGPGAMETACTNESPVEEGCAPV